MWRCKKSFAVDVQHILEREIIVRGGGLLPLWFQGPCYTRGEASFL